MRELAFNWTKEAEDFLREYYPTHDTKEIAEELGVSPRAVTTKACKLKIKKDYNAIEVPEGFFLCSGCRCFYQTNTGKRGNGYCPKCNSERQREKKQQRIIEQSKKKQGITELEKDIQETAKKLYVCSTCGKEKLGKDFKYDKRRKKRESACYSCRNEKNKKTKLNRIKEGRGW